MTRTKIGVWICECGGNISDVVETGKIVEEIKDEVDFTKVETYLCSSPSVEEIKKSVQDKGLDRLVLACCTPKMHKETFKSNLEGVGIIPAFLEIVNIREQCSWVHKDDGEGATQKALDLIRGGIARTKESVKLIPKSLEINPEVLVIGGGVAGITTSLRLAEQGFQVNLVEKNPSIGGHMIQFPKVFPTLDCSQCILTPKMAQISQNKNINLITYSEVEDVSGGSGDFLVRIRLKPRGVNPEICIGCGDCTRVCPTETNSEYNEGLGKRKAVYIPFPQSVPSSYTIDFDACTRCGACERTCPAKAINLNDEGGVLELKVGAIVITTGYELFDLKGLANYGYGRYPNVITGLEMERILDINGPTQGRLIVPKTGKEVNSISYILCAGSRDTEVGHPYCSRVCCLYALKQAQLLRDRGVDVYIHYIDIRSPGRRYEEFYRTTQDKGTVFIKGKVTEVVPQRDNILVHSEDMMLNRMVEYPVDLVVLAPPIIPSDDTLKLAEKLRIPVDEDQFILESHPKLDPLATKREGVFAAGMVLGPKDIQTTTAEAEGAAMKATNFLSGERLIEPDKAYLAHPRLCDGCGDCAEVCPEKAVVIQNQVPEINEVLCSGCGTCIPACPRGALDQQGLTEAQLKAQIRGTLEGSDAPLKILAFVEREVAYTAVDLAGLARLTYPSSVRVIPLPSMARLGIGHILYAYAHGADGVMLLEAPEHEGPYGEAHIISEERADEYRWDIEGFDVDSSRFWFSRVYVPDWRKLELIFKTFHQTVEDEGPIEEEIRSSIMDRL
jgi:heterodisulfide reductase subunit A